MVQGLQVYRLSGSPIRRQFMGPIAHGIDSAATTRFYRITMWRYIQRHMPRHRKQCHLVRRIALGHCQSLANMVSCLGPGV